MHLHQIDKFGDHQPEEGLDLQLFEVQKQIQFLKLLKERNLALSAKLKTIQSNVIAKIKHNDSLSKTFKFRRTKPEDPKAGIFGVSFYRYELQHKIPPSLETYFELQIPKEKQSIFLKNVFESTSQPQLPLGLADSSVRLEEIVKGYPSNPSQIPFDRVGIFYGVSGLAVYELWRTERMKLEQKKTPFGKQENQQLLSLHNKYGDNWRHISKLTEFRSSEELYYQYNVINPEFKKGRWRLWENLSLLVLVEVYQVPNYHKMALKLKTRSEGQIRERYINVLDPKKRIKEWTEKEAKLLLLRAAEFKYRWAKLAEVFQHKTDNQVWRKFRGAMAEKSFEQIHELILDDKIKKAVLDYKQKYKIPTRGNQGHPRKQVKLE